MINLPIHESVRRSVVRIRAWLISSACLLLTGGIASASHPVCFSILDFGARKDGITVNTVSIQSAIDSCSASGGGTVFFPAGRYVSGTIYLKSNVTLYLDAGSVLEGSKNLADYPVTISKIRSYTDNYTDKSLIYAEGVENISITGKGKIDGNGAAFKVENTENNEGLRKKDKFFFYKSRPYLIRMINCRNILIRDVTILDSPMWVQHYMLCEDVNINGITVRSRVNHNNDGIDIDGCSRVHISDCDIISGDDAIVLKSTQDRPCENVTVTNCTLSSDCNAFKLGTETNGGFRNITLSNCTIYDTHLSGITLQIVDGGTLDGVLISNVTMNNVGDAIFIRLGNRARPYADGMGKPGMGSLSHVVIDNIQGTHIGKTGCSITGLPGYMVENISLSNICLSFEGGGLSGPAKQEIPELPAAYPEHNMYGDLPSYGFYCRHCRNLRFENVELGYENPEARDAMVFDDIENLDLGGLKAGTEGTAAVIEMTGVKNALIRSCMATRGTATFLQLIGIENSHITMTGNDLGYAQASVAGVNKSSVFLDANRLPPLYGLSDGPYVNCGMQYTDDREIRIHSPAEVMSLRKEIINAIWGTAKLPDRADVLVTKGIQSPLSPYKGLSRVDRIEIPVIAAYKDGEPAVNDLAYLFVPVSRNNRLVLINPGHTCKINSQPGNEYGIEAAIDELLQDGFDVLTVFMPHVSDTVCNLDHCSIINTPLPPGEHPATYGLRFFLEPEIVSLNYLLQMNNYTNINMVGLSGGGWTTNLLAAIDDRISFSFSVAGSMPLYYRSEASMGDIEQFLPELYRDIAGYPDLYVLGAFGTGRKQIQILNRKDDCCFGEKQHVPGRNYDADLKTYEADVKEKMKQLGAEDHYYLVIDETAPKHQISEYALRKIIMKELNAE